MDCSRITLGPAIRRTHPSVGSRALPRFTLPGAAAGLWGDMDADATLRAIRRASTATYLTPPPRD